MNEHAQPKNRENFSKDTPDTAAVLKKMQYQLDAIERKIDSLLKQSGPRDFKSTYPSKPRREYDETKRSFKPKHTKRKEEAPSEGKFYHGLQSGVKKSPDKSRFGGKKRSLKR